MEYFNDFLFSGIGPSGHYNGHSNASYSLNLFGHNTEHERLQTYANMALGQYILKQDVECVQVQKGGCHVLEQWQFLRNIFSALATSHSKLV